MNSKDRRSTIFKLALPTSLGMISTMAMDLVDMMMVGSLGTSAIAAIGVAGLIHIVVLSFVTNISLVIQGVVANRLGEGSKELACIPLNAGLLTAVAIGTPLTLLGYFLTPWYFSLVSSDLQLVREGVPYLQVVLIATIAIGMNTCFDGFWRGNGNTKVYMWIILFINILNIALNYILIFGNFGAPALGTVGAGVGTLISIVVALSIWFFITNNRYQKDGFLCSGPSLKLVKTILGRTLTLSVGEIFFTLGMIVFFSIVAKIGTAELAAVTVLTRINLLLLVIPESLGLASATLVAKALGIGNQAQASQWGWDAGKMGVFGVMLFGIPLALFPAFFLSLFIGDQYTISIAELPLQLTVVSTSIISLIYVLGIILFSLGDGGRIMIASFILQWIVFLPVAWTFGLYLNYGLLIVWLSYLLYSILTAISIYFIWMLGAWKNFQG